MVKTALDDITLPPSAQLLGWRLLDARPQEGWIKVGFDGKREFCNAAGFVQGGFLSAMLDPTMAAAAIVMSEGRLYTSTVSITVNFLAPAKPGPIVAEAKVTQHSCPRHRISSPALVPLITRQHNRNIGHQYSGHLTAPFGLPANERGVNRCPGMAGDCGQTPPFCPQKRHCELHPKTIISAIFAIKCRASSGLVL